MSTTLFWSCFEGDPLHDIDGKNLSNANIHRDTLYTTNSRSVVEGRVSTALSTKLLLGSYKGFETRSLIQFGSIPPDTIEVDSLTLVCTSLENQGEATGPISGTAYLVITDWPESVNEDESWNWQDKISYLPETSARFDISPESSRLHYIKLPAALMKVWQDTIGGNHNFGILLDFDQADYIKQFSSVDALFSGQRPKLGFSYYSTSLDSTIYDTIFVAKDASLIDFNGSFDQEKIYVASGISVRSFFEFDLSAIPASAALATMNFKATRDTMNSVYNPQSLQNMYFRTVTTALMDLPYYQVDSSFTQNLYFTINLQNSDDQILSIVNSERGTGSQNFLQNIVNGDVQYGSFMVQYKYEGEDVSVYTIIDGPGIEKHLKPALIVEYYDIPEPRL